MASVTINPLSFAQRQLIDPKGQLNAKEISKFLGDLSQWANQIQQNLINQSSLASILNGSNQLLASSVSSSLSEPGNISTNQTINTNKALIIAFTAIWTAAANATLTFNNVPPGAVCYIRLNNNSAAARTFTYLANTPSSVAIPVIMNGAGGVSVLSSGVSVNNGATLSIMGICFGDQINGIGFDA